MSNQNEIYVGIYCRLSEEDRNKANDGDDSGSIINQKAMLSQYAKESGWRIYRIYVDDDYSGAFENRPGFQQLLREAEEGKFSIILCKSQARFSRDTEVIEKYLHRLFPIWGIRFIGLSDNADTANKGNKKSRQINALVNEWYLEDLSNNVRAGLTIMRQQGKHIGGRALYGYQIDPADRHHLIIDDEAAGVVRRIFDMYISGSGKQHICTTLNREKILSPSAYKIEKGIPCNGRGGYVSDVWKCPTINYILNNEMYIGNLVQNKHTNVSYKTAKMKMLPPEEWIVVPHTHEPIIDLETWNKAKKLQISRNRQGKTGELNLFSGFVKCKSCGYKAATNKNHGRRYLICPTRRICKDACEGFCISEQDLERIVLQELRKMFELYYDRKTIKDSIVLESDSKISEDILIRKVHLAEKERENIFAAKTDAYLDKSKGVISEIDFSIIIKGLSDREREIEAKIIALQDQIREVKEAKKIRSNKNEILLKYGSITALNRGIITALIDHIEVSKRTTGDPPVYIHWNF